MRRDKTLKTSGQLGVPICDGAMCEKVIVDRSWPTIFSWTTLDAQGVAREEPRTVKRKRKQEHSDDYEQIALFLFVASTTLVGIYLVEVNPRVMTLIEQQELVKGRVAKGEGVVKGAPADQHELPEGEGVAKGGVVEGGAVVGTIEETTTISVASLGGEIPHVDSWL